MTGTGTRTSNDRSTAAATANALLGTVSSIGYERLVYSIPVNMGLRAEDADDVVQATFAEFLGNIDLIREPDRVGSWLATVSKRQSIRVIERRERDRRGVDSLPTDVVDDDEWTRRVEEIEWVEQAMAMPSDRCRRLLTALCFTDPAPAYEDIARRGDVAT